MTEAINSRIAELTKQVSDQHASMLEQAKELDKLKEWSADTIDGQAHQIQRLKHELSCIDPKTLTFSPLRERVSELEKERDKLFLELGKYADVPSFEYWKDRAEKAEKERDAARAECVEYREALKWAKHFIEIEEQWLLSDESPINKALSSPGHGAEYALRVERLIEALKGVIRVADRKTIEFEAAHSALATWRGGV
jgi:hypothetical protein